MNLLIIFPSSKSPSLSRAVEIAKKSNLYYVEGEGAAARHQANFDETSAAGALSLINILYSWKGVEIIVNGHPESAYHIQNTLTCYLRSKIVADYRAYCCRVERDYHQTGGGVGIVFRMADPDEVMERIKQRQRDAEQEAEPQVEPRVIPCKWVHAPADTRHPASAADQYEAQAVERGVWWCPNFKQGEGNELK